jgi:outer membrane protein TolC
LPSASTTAPSDQANQSDNSDDSETSDKSDKKVNPASASGNSPQSTREATPPEGAATLGQRPSEAQQRLEDRFDRLQNESQIQQRLNQSEFRTYDRTLTPEPSSLQMEQMIQQQISLPDSQNPAVNTSPSDTLDRLQFEQRVRQRLRPAEPRSDVSSSSTDSRPPEAETLEAARPEPAPTPEATPNSSDQPEAPEAAKAQTEPTETEAAADRSPEANSATSQVEESQPDSQTDSQTEASQADAKATDQPPSEQAATGQDTTEPTAIDETATGETATGETATGETATDESAAPSEQAEVDSTPRPEVKPLEGDRPRRRRARRQPRPQSATAQAEAQPDVQPETAQSEAETTEAETASETAQSESETAQSGPAESPADTTPAAETLPSIPFDPNPTGGSTADTDLFPTDDEPAPEYLDPNPNPLAFPTQTEEVELVGTQPITLEQAIELAVRNNPELRQSQFQLERSQADLRERLALNLPTLDANTSFQQTGQETVNRVPETVTDAQGNEVPNPNPDAGELVREYTDTATALGAGIELNYNIFTSGRRPALIEAARSQVRLQQLEIERQTEQLILETTGDYYDLQQAGAQVNIFSANLDQAEQSLRDAQALERAGVGTRFDVLQAEVDVANARQRLTQQLSDLEVARRQLAQRLNIAQTVNVTAADPIEVAGVWELSLEESIVQAYKNRVELEQQLIQREIAQQNRRAALAQLGPQVRFQGTFDVTNNLDTDAFFESFGYRYGLALQASLALFDGGVARAQADEEESNIAIAESEFENVQNQIRLDVERGFSQLNASFTNIQTTALAVEQATEALRLARLRFQAGVGTQTDVLRQQSVLAEAQVNNLNAILDYNRALAVLRRAISNYPEGYLNDQP